MNLNSNKTKCETFYRFDTLGSIPELSELLHRLGNFILSNEISIILHTFGDNLNIGKKGYSIDKEDYQWQCFRFVLIECNKSDITEDSVKKDFEYEDIELGVWSSHSLNIDSFSRLRDILLERFSEEELVLLERYKEASVEMYSPFIQDEKEILYLAKRNLQTTLIIDHFLK